jgi:hypothetical protein
MSLSSAAGLALSEAAPRILDYAVPLTREMRLRYRRILQKMTCKIAHAKGTNRETIFLKACRGRAALRASAIFGISSMLRPTDFGE